MLMIGRITPAAMLTAKGVPDPSEKQIGDLFGGAIEQA
jgi:hypothetical protein